MLTVCAAVPAQVRHTQPWLLDLQSTAARLFGKLARVQIVGSLPVDEERRTKWLNSPLFTGGFEKDFESKESKSGR